MSSYDFDFLTNDQEANKQAILLAKVRYNEQLSPFINSPFAQDQEARLRYASDHIERIIDECCEAVKGSERDVVSGRLKTIISKEVATTQPQKRNVTEQVGGDADPPEKFGDPDVGNAVQQDILDRDAVLENEILDADAQIEAGTPLSEGEVQYPKQGSLKERLEKLANLEDYIEFGQAYNDLGWSIQEQLTELLDQGSSADLNGNAVHAMKALLRKLPDEEAEELEKAIREWEEKQYPTSKVAGEVYPGSECPNCGSDSWDFINNGDAICQDCGFEWTPEDAENNWTDTKTACARCNGECDGEGPVCSECGNFLASKEAAGYQQQVPTQQMQTVQQQPMQQAPMQPATNPNQQMKCDVCGFVGNAAQVQDHYQKMVAANDQLHMNSQPAGNQTAQPGTVQASIHEAKYQYIEHRDGSWVILQKGTGKVLSHHSSYEQAVASFKAMMANKHGAAQDFLAQPHNHDQEDRAEGQPVKEDTVDTEESKDPSDRFDEVVQNIADHAAAKRYSQADKDEVQQIADRYGVSTSDVDSHLHIVALFGDYTGFNGEIVDSDPDTTGLTSINDEDLGGQVETHEALVPLNLALKQTADALGMQEQDVSDQVQESLGGEDLPDQYHASVEGQRNFYLPDSMASGAEGSTETDNTQQPQQPQQPQPQQDPRQPQQ